MVNGINAYYNLSQLFSSPTTSRVEGISSLFDYNSVQKQSASLLSSFKANNTTVNKLKDDSANFLKQYTGSMNDLNKAAGKLTNGNINGLLYDKSGAVTADTVKNTVSAVKDMVDSYNNTLKTLNDNADRGYGVENQIRRMADDPAAESSMEMVGVSVNKDGTLALNEEELTEALSTDNADQRKLYSDIIGGSTGIAAGVQKDARAGLRESAQGLIANDLAQMQSIRNDDPIRAFAQSLRGGGAYALNNAAAMGILMNLTA